MDRLTLTILDMHHVTLSRDAETGPATAALGIGSHHVALPAPYGSDLRAAFEGAFAEGEARPLLDWLIERRERYLSMAITAEYIVRQLSVT